MSEDRDLLFGRAVAGEYPGEFRGINLPGETFYPSKGEEPKPVKRPLPKDKTPDVKPAKVAESPPDKTPKDPVQIVKPSATMSPKKPHTSVDPKMDVVMAQSLDMNTLTLIGLLSGGAIFGYYGIKKKWFHKAADKVTSALPFKLPF